MLRFTVVSATLASCLFLGGAAPDKQMKTIPALANERLQTKCDKSCTDEQRRLLAEAVKWVLTIEADPSFREEFARHQHIDQKQWIADHPNEHVKTTDEIINDLVPSSASAETHMLKSLGGTSRLRWPIERCVRKKTSTGTRPGRSRALKTRAFGLRR